MWEHLQTKYINTFKTFKTSVPTFPHTEVLNWKSGTDALVPLIDFFLNPVHEKSVGTVGTWEQTAETQALSHI